MKEIKIDIFKTAGMIFILMGIFSLSIELGFKLLFGVGWVLWNSTLAITRKRD